jgi:hypothetical protein
VPDWIDGSQNQRSLSPRAFASCYKVNSCEHWLYCMTKLLHISARLGYSDKARREGICEETPLSGNSAWIIDGSGVEQ